MGRLGEPGSETSTDRGALGGLITATATPVRAELPPPLGSGPRHQCRGPKGSVPATGTAMEDVDASLYSVPVSLYSYSQLKIQNGSV